MNKISGKETSRRGVMKEKETMGCYVERLNDLNAK